MLSLDGLFPAPAFLLVAMPFRDKSGLVFYLGALSNKIGIWVAQGISSSIRMAPRRPKGFCTQHLTFASALSKSEYPSSSLPPTKAMAAIKQEEEDS